MSSHECFLCRRENPLRVFDGAVARFPRRFVGPPQRVHGGMAVAALMCPAHQVVGDDHSISFVSGRLNAALPLERDLVATVEQGEIAMITIALDGTALMMGKVDFCARSEVTDGIIRGIPVHLAAPLGEMCAASGGEVDGPTLMDMTDRLYAQAGYSNAGFTCFGCSGRDGALRLHNRISASGDLWTRWEVEEEFVEQNGMVAPSMIVAALDCPNLWATYSHIDGLGVPLRLEEGSMWITGSHTVHLLREAPAEGDYRIMARMLRTDGRKSFTMSALIDRDGTPYAVSEAVNILIDEPAEMKMPRLSGA